MNAFICTTCGIQYEPATTSPLTCKICEDERQYVNPGGQCWTTLPQLNKQCKNIFEEVRPGLFAIYSTPAFAIGQLAHLIISPGGNVLWDCISNLDQSTITLIKALGGLSAIAISHPHYFSTMQEWSKAFGDIPVYVAKQDEAWLGRSFEALRLWDENKMDLWDGLQLIRCGGHFPGACVMYDPGENGSLFVGDTIQVNPDLSTVSFMYSYPNLIPLSKKEIDQVNNAVNDVAYERMYGAFGRYITHKAKAAMQRSVDRYLKIY